MHEIELKGLDGSNLLAFMAGIGTLRCLTPSDPGIRMRWVDRGVWIPLVQHSRIGTADRLVDAVAECLCGEVSINRAWEISQDLTISRMDFRNHVESEAAKATPADRSATDFLAAFGSEVFGSGPKREQMSDTEFRTMSGAGHQHFLGFMRELTRTTDRTQIWRALMEPWDYADGRPSLRWDPADYRPHALRATDPSGDPIRTMRGANRLAVEALPLFPTVARNGRVRTVGFQKRNRETEITWPIWTDAVDLETARTLIAISELQYADVADSSSKLACRGITQVFRARRFIDGKYRNFAPAKALL
jgi:hypothetical protein